METKQAVRAVANLAVLGAIVYYSIPNRPPLAPYTWRALANGAQALADGADVVSLWARSHYWRSVRP